MSSNTSETNTSQAKHRIPVSYATASLSSDFFWKKPKTPELILIFLPPVKIRLNHPAVAATVYPHENENAKILFDEPQEAVCPGQHAVFYREDTVLGGGVIQQAIGL